MPEWAAPEAPAEVTEDDHHAENEDALTIPETSRGRQHSQHSQHLQNAINYSQKYVHSTGTDGENVDLETIDEDPGPRNRTTNQCIGQNRMIETNHQTKIEDCRTVTILSLREMLKNHVLNLTTVDTVNLEINVGTLILSNLTIISNIINRCTLFYPKCGPWWAL